MMNRTQIYLTDEEKCALHALARQHGRSFSATLREAVDDYIARHRASELAEALEASFGCWRVREAADLDIARLRQEWGERESRFR
jgi:hypothetical protein